MEEKSITELGEYLRTESRRLNMPTAFISKSKRGFAIEVVMAYYGNTDNRLAYQYLVAYYVLTNDRERYAKLLQQTSNRQ